jgi:ketosteroid isomerase-like protein
MKLRIAAPCALAAALLAGCAPDAQRSYKEELIAADRAFSALSAQKGPKAASLEYMTGDVKILKQYRSGSAGIHDIFVQLPENVQLTWEAANVDASSFGDLGYTWGRYTMVLPALPMNNLKPYRDMGDYVMVWKRDHLGRWKVVLFGSIRDH